MSDQQRYSEEEVHSILREALRLPSANSESGFSKEDIRRFAAEAGISGQAVEQSLSKHKSRRRAKLIEKTRKTTITLDWELSRQEIDGIAAMCEVLPPYGYRSMGNYDTIRIDRWGFYCMVSILRKDGFTHISMDRQNMIEIETGFSLFGVILLYGMATLSVTSGQSLTSLTPFALLLASMLVFAFALWRTKVSQRKRVELAELIADELKATFLD